MWDLIKKYWTAALSLCASSIISWLLDFNIAGMNKVTSFISLFLTIWVALTVIVEHHHKHKIKSFGEKIILNQKQVKILEQSLNPEKPIKDMVNLLDQTRKEFHKMKKFKNFWKDIWCNKATYTSTLTTLIIAVISQIVVFTDYLYRISWCAEHKLFIQIAAPILAVAWVILDLYTTWTKYGKETIAEYQRRKDSKLSKEQKVEIKNKISNLEKAIETATAKYSKALRFVTDLDTLVKSGYITTQSENIEYQTSKNTVTSLQNTLESLKAELATEKAKL